MKEAGSGGTISVQDGKSTGFWQNVWNNMLDHQSSVYALNGSVQTGGPGGQNPLAYAEVGELSDGIPGGAFGDQLSDNVSVSDAKSYGDLFGKSSREQLEWLINNDPENSQGWLEQLIGLTAERENVQDARAYEKMMQDTKIQRAAKDLEAAGINPILAYQYLSGSSSSVGAAGYSDIGVSNQAVERESSKRTKSASDTRAVAALAAGLVALVGVVIRAVA